MKLIHTDDTASVFHLSHRERDILVEILALYPLVPAAHQPLSRDQKFAATAESQHLLDEALAEQRAGNKRQLQTWLDAPDRFQRANTGCQFTLRRADAEWLLQVLNDIRVGSWLRLGSPEEHLEPGALDPHRHRVWATMEVSGFFQMAILQALEGPTSG